MLTEEVFILRSFAGRTLQPCTLKSLSGVLAESPPDSTVGEFDERLHEGFISVH